MQRLYILLYAYADCYKYKNGVFYNNNFNKY